MSRAVTYSGQAGQSVFASIFPVTSAGDLTVTVNGTPASFTYSNGVVTLSAPLGAASTVSITAADVTSGSVGGATEATLEAVEALLATPASVLPPTPLMAPGDLTGVVVNSTANTDIPLVAAQGAGLKGRVYRGHLTVTGAATTVFIYDDASASGAIIDRFDVPATGGVFDFPLDGRAYWASQANKPLVMKQTGGAQLSGRFSFGPAAA